MSYTNYMKQTTNAASIEPYEALLAIVESLNRRFPGGENPFQQITRLCEEAGELAQAVNHREGAGVKREKHGDPDDQAFVKEVQDVMVAALDIARYYGLLDELKRSIAERYDVHKRENFNK